MPRLPAVVGFTAETGLSDGSGLPAVAGGTGVPPVNLSDLSTWKQKLNR
jgi:hypothetical protein